MTDLRRHPIARRIVQACRLALPASARDQPMLVACSGGADSVALLLALASAGLPVIVAHVLHNMRSIAQASADRDAVAALAASLRLRFVETSVQLRSGPSLASIPPLPTNIEAQARHLRLAALAKLARESGARTVATGHHADDQLETILMALLRGAGTRGLSAMPVRRVLSKSPDTLHQTVWLIRPMLHPIAAITRAQCEQLCSAANVRWQVDHTNADTTRLRSNLRTNVLPALRLLRPAAAAHACSTAAILRDAASTLEAHAKRLLVHAVSSELDAHPPPSRGHLTFRRETLWRTRSATLGALVRQSVAHVSRERPQSCSDLARDRLSYRVLAPIVRAIKDHSTEPREFLINSSAGTVLLRLTAHELHVRPGPPPHGTPR